MSFPAQQSSLGGTCRVVMTPPKNSKGEKHGRPLFQRHPGNKIEHNRMLQTKLLIARETVSERRQRCPLPARTTEPDATLDSELSTLTRTQSLPTVFQPPNSQAITAHMPGYMGFVPGHTSKSETLGVAKSYGLATASAIELLGSKSSFRASQTAGQFPIRRTFG
mmetsp:Transcript_14451/g.26614  ORF Transcript_14451/g.26614 Transcript_14451/m.26614 type:complete len:165 (-) Transcript_14451:152-646(-)